MVFRMWGAQAVIQRATGLFAVRRGDVQSAWSGIRPLVSDPTKGDTQSIARNHLIEVADNKLITVAGMAGRSTVSPDGD